MKKLINGDKIDERSSVSKRKQRSQETPHHPLARAEHVSVHVDGNTL